MYVYWEPAPLLTPSAVGSSGAPLFLYQRAFLGRPPSLRGPSVSRYIAAAVTLAASPRGRRRALAVALVVAVLVVGGVWTAVARGRGGAQADPGAQAAVIAVIPELEAFVEHARGLKFLSPVKVSVVDAATFRRIYDQGGTTDAGGPGTQTGTLRVLGLIQGGGGSGGGSDADSVDGFYDSDTKELVVRGTRPTPFVRQVLVHELTHALDDQHFGLDPPMPDDEASLAYDALVEGDATSVEYRYVDSLSPEEQQEAAAEEDAAYAKSASGSGSDASDPLVALDDFPYDIGPDFIDALVADGGQARVDTAFGHPPTTSAEVLHPERYLSGRGRAPVPEVASDAKVVDEGVLGEFLLQLVLEETVPEAEAMRAATGWAGDHYVAWRSGRRTCVRATVVLDSDTDAAELASMLRRWAADHRGATVEGTSAITLGRCA